MTDTPYSSDMANAIRALSMDAVQAANSGHPGMPMGMADVATVLFSKHMKFDASAPRWPDRDRFVLSAGHGSMLLYSLLHLTGYEDMTIDQIRNFRQLDSRCAGHPEFGEAAGIETTTGPLGQGISTAVGMALAERMLNARYGDALVDHFTYVVAGDGCLMEGISQEAIGLAGHLNLSRLIVLWDDNSITIDGETGLSTSENMQRRFEAAGWDFISVDGHDMTAVDAALAAAKATDKPSLIGCKTIIGKGAPNKQGTSATHGAPLGDDEISATRETIGWPHAPFEVPADILNPWHTAGARGAADRKAWEDCLNSSDHQQAFELAQSDGLGPDFDSTMAAYRAKLAEEMPKVATRKASQMALEVINAAVSHMAGGSADLTGSNLTKTGDQKAVQAGQFDGSYIYYGIREHGMAAAMNGIALHRGLIPYGGTFMVFTDYCRPAIRLSALMKQRVIYVMTHDSIGLGEDGPTHQPVEHLASLRAMPNVNVMRPADAMETAECWEIALKATHTPSILALSRQGVPAVRTDGSENKSAKGAYELAPADGEAKVTILATGTEIEIALSARDELQQDGIPTRVVSMPCWELFDKQSTEYQLTTLNMNTVRIAVEAASTFGWEKYTGPDGAVIGMTGFGASAPAGDLYNHFGITAEAVVHAAKARI